MLNARRSLIGSAALLLAACTMSPPPAALAASPSVWIRPTAIATGGQATVYGSHVPAGFYSLLLAVPYLRKGAEERFFGLVHVGGHGTIKSTVRLPAATHCGHASIYLYAPHRKLLRLKIKLIHCSAGHGKIPPPPPPGGKKP